LGTSDTEYVHRLGQAKVFAHNLSRPVSRAAADLALRSIIQPAMEYPLGTVYFTPEQSHRIQSEIILAALPKMGFSRTMPQAVVFGPTELGGIGLNEYYTKQCIWHITTLMGLIRQPGQTGLMIRCTL
jgi:hypothetical protein